MQCIRWTARAARRGVSAATVRQAISGSTASTIAICGVIGFIAGCSRSGSERPQASVSPTSSIDRYSAKTQSSSSPRVAFSGQEVAKGGGAYKLGAPYKISGRWYVPTEDPAYDRTGLASWYGSDFHGRKTANGEVFDMYALTAAHPTLPLPSYAYVTSASTGRTVLVRINDRGPYARDRIMDLSKRTAEALGVAAAGVSEVRVKYAGRAPLSGDDSHERRFLASQPWAGSVASNAAPRMGLLR